MYYFLAHGSVAIYLKISKCSMRGPLWPLKILCTLSKFAVIKSETVQPSFNLYKLCSYQIHLSEFFK